MAPLEYKLVVFGAGGVGKSAVTQQFVAHKFVKAYDPSISDTYKKQETVDGDVAILDIVDTAGQEEYKTLRAHYYSKGEGFIAVYSIADRGSFQEVEAFRDAVLEERNCDKVPMVLIGNKCDLSGEQRKVSTKEGETLAASWFGEGKISVPFFETSALTNTNVDDTFHQVVREIRKAKGGGGASAPAPTPAAAAAPAQAAAASPPAADAGKKAEPAAGASAPPAAGKAKPKPSGKTAKPKPKGKKGKKDGKKKGGCTIA